MGGRRESVGWTSVSPGRGAGRVRRPSEVSTNASEYESVEPETPEQVGLGLGLAFVEVAGERRERILEYQEEEEEMDRAFPKLGSSPVMSEFSLQDVGRWGVLLMEKE